MPSGDPTRRVTFIALLSIAWSLAAHAQSTTIDFKGVPLGGPESAWAEKVGIKCVDLPERFRALGDRACRESVPNPGPASPNELNYGGVVARSIGGYFLQDKLAMVRVIISPSEFPVVRSALVEKFGKPTKIETPEYQTKGGVVTRNEIVTWTRADSQLVARRLGGSLSESQIEYSYLPAIPEIDRRLNERAKEGAKAL